MLKFLITLIFLFNILINAKNVTKDIKYIGTPYVTQYKSGEDIYSRNVWDLQVYDNLLFIGAGNSANEGPSINSGPIPLVKYNPLTNKFKKETIIYDDQVDIFKVLDKNLFIPGHDATGSWNWGNFYLRGQNNSWHMYRNIPRALHIYDLALIDNKLYAGIGLDEGAAVGVTTDLGKHWDIIKLGRSRVYSFLTIGNQFYALKKFKRTSQPYFSVAQYYKGNFIPRYDISIYDFFPDTRFKIKYSRVTRIINFKNQAIYVGAYKYNSHQTKPFGLYTIKSIGQKLIAKRIKLEKAYVPRDILKREDTLYILTSKTNKYDTTIKVLKMDINDLVNYKVLFSFQYTTFARSFELINDTFYFGMGSDVDEGNNWKMKDIKKETGDILSYKGIK